MGQRFPICNAQDVIRVLRRNGFVKVGQKGSHQKWRHADAPSDRRRPRQQTDSYRDAEEHHRGRETERRRISLISLSVKNALPHGRATAPIS
jgi:hypothetical protein